MSDSDSFIQEVNEEVRRDRFYGFLRRYGWLFGAIVGLVIGAAALNEWRNARAERAAEAAGDAIGAALDNARAETRLSTLADIDADGARGAIVGLLTAASAVEADAPGRASDALARVAGDGGVADIYQDLAVLKRVALEADLAPEDRIETLEPLTQPGAPYRLLAIEQIALAEIEAGRPNDALVRLVDLLEQSALPEGLRTRAGQLVIALGGAPEAT